MTADLETKLHINTFFLNKLVMLSAYMGDILMPAHKKAICEDKYHAVQNTSCFYKSLSFQIISFNFRSRMSRRQYFDMQNCYVDIYLFYRLKKGTLKCILCKDALNKEEGVFRFKSVGSTLQGGLAARVTYNYALVFKGTPSDPQHMSYVYTTYV